MEKKGDQVILSFRFENSRYEIEYFNDVLIKISKDKKFIGKTYIVNSNSSRKNIETVIGEFNDLKKVDNSSELLNDSVELNELETIKPDSNIKSNETVVPNDVMIELIREELIYDSKNNKLNEKEAFLLKPGLFHKLENSYTLSESLSLCTNFRLEHNTIIPSFLM